MIEKSYRAKKGAYGGKIRHQPCIERYIELVVTLTRNYQSFWCKVDFVVRISDMILEQCKNYQLFFVAYLLFKMLFLICIRLVSFQHLKQGI